MKTVLAAALSAVLLTTPAWAQTKVTAVLEGDLSIIDPLTTTTYITRNISNLVYDVLFARGLNGDVHPQMVDKWTASKDGLVWSFTLRDGLKFHDGKPVMAKDAALSLQRWGKRNFIGRALMAKTKSVVADDAKTFTLTLSEPFPAMLTALSSNLFVMPERLAVADAATPVKEVMGSGPFMMKMEDWVPGSKLTLRKNPNYVSRKEPSDGLAGAKKVEFDTLELRFIADQETRFSALTRGEVDYIQTIGLDYIPLAKKDPNLTLDPMGGRLDKMGLIIMNQAQPPFDKPEVRRALQYAIDSAPIMAALGVPKEFSLPECRSIYACGSFSKYATKAGYEEFTKPNLEKARELLKKSGYAGEKVVSLHTTNLRHYDVATTVIEEQLRKVGFNVQSIPVEWNGVMSRQGSKAAADKGGWSLFVLASDVTDLTNPLLNSYANRNCSDFVSGFFCNPKITELQNQLLLAKDDKAVKALSEQIQREFAAANHLVFWGQFSLPAVYRKQVTNVSPAGFPLFWNVKKAN